MGGLITMVVSARRPDLLGSAILNDIGPDIDPKGLDRIKGYVGVSATVEDWDGAADYARKINGEAFPQETGSAFWLAFARRIFKAGPDGRPVLDYDPAISGAVKAGNVVSEPPWTAFAGLASVPTLVIRGALSDILSAEIVNRMREKKPDLAETIVPDVGHAPLLTEPVAAAAIAAWLAEGP
jgi:pimeloyl-ACP methyl ester carboxylesterase